MKQALNIVVVSFLLLLVNCDNSFDHKNLISLNTSNDSLIHLDQLSVLVNDSKEVKLVFNISSEDNKSLFSSTYSTSDKMVINELLIHMECREVGGDIATLSSYMQLEIDGKTVFYANLEISDSLLGIQTSQLGYCKLSQPISIQTIVGIMD